MKVKEEWLYDDSYDMDVADWENFLRYSRLPVKLRIWYKNLAIPFLLIGFGFAGDSWRLWVGVLGLYLVFAKIFTFCEELNENIRYTRQLIINGFKRLER